MFRVLSLPHQAGRRRFRLGIVLARLGLLRCQHCCCQHFPSCAIAVRARTRLIWIAIAGAAIGYGIWATHFIAMLAYEPGVTTGYGIVLTALSLATAMLLTSGGVGLAVK